MPGPNNASGAGLQPDPSVVPGPGVKTDPNHYV